MRLRARCDLFPAPNNCPESTKRRSQQGPSPTRAVGVGRGLVLSTFWGTVSTTHTMHVLKSCLMCSGTMQNISPSLRAGCKSQELG